MKPIFLSLFLLFSLNSICQNQVVDTFSYLGPPKHIREKTISTTPNSVYEFVFCTINIPDSLQIRFCDKQIDLYIGSVKDRPLTLTGFIDLQWDTFLTIIDTSYKIPSEINQTKLGCDFPQGVLRLIVKMPNQCCNLSWRVVGNYWSHTIYSIQVFEINPGYYSEIADTIYDYSCDRAYMVYKTLQCKKYLYVYADSSIHTNAVITQPDCNGLGSVEFTGDYSSFSQFNLDTGFYRIPVYNSVCTKYFTFTLDDKGICNLYIPNVIKLNTGQNNTFSVFCDKNLKYQMEIYDRWGSLVYRGRHETNDLNGWNGTNKGSPVNPGVFVYRIVIEANTTIEFTGDVTVLD